MCRSGLTATRWRGVRSTSAGGGFYQAGAYHWPLQVCRTAVITVATIIVSSPWRSSTIQCWGRNRLVRAGRACALNAAVGQRRQFTVRRDGIAARRGCLQHGVEHLHTAVMPYGPMGIGVGGLVNAVITPSLAARARIRVAEVMRHTAAPGVRSPRPCAATVSSGSERAEVAVPASSDGAMRSILRGARFRRSSSGFACSTFATHHR